MHPSTYGCLAWANPVVQASQLLMAKIVELQILVVAMQSAQECPFQHLWLKPTERGQRFTLAGHQPAIPQLRHVMDILMYFKNARER